LAPALWSSAGGVEFDLSLSGANLLLDFLTANFNPESFMTQINHGAPAPAKGGEQADFLSRYNSAKYHLLALALLCGGVYFYRLGYLPFLGPDEPRYAAVAREMYLSGDWVTPRLAGLHWFEKPALTYWLAAAGYTLFGVSEFAARFGVAAAATAGVLMLYFFGRRVGSARFGYLSAAALATSGLWVGFGQASTFDLPLAVTFEVALLSFFLWERGDAAGSGGSRLWLVSCFGMGLAVLAKGLVGVVLPSVIIGLYLLLTGRLLALLKRPLLLAAGAAVFLATVSTWYAPMLIRHGQEFVNEFFIGHHFQRFLTNKYKHPQPFYFFFFVALVGCFPWTLQLQQQALDLIRSRRELTTSPQARLKLYLWLWVMIPVLFFSLSTSKLTGYILPIFPAVALLIGIELEKLWAGKDYTRWRWSRLQTPLLLFAVSVGLGFKADEELMVSSRAAWAVAALGIALALAYLLLLLKSARLAALFLPFGLAVVLVVVKHLLLPGLGYVDSTRDLALAAARAARPGERLVFFINNDFSIDFYATGLPLRDERAYLITLMKPEEVEAVVKSQPGGSLLVISRERWSPGLTETMQAEVLGAQRDLILLRLRPKD
jgi:4-amino-4-deoxy-L-arabinose transferase-like glycosyltransferase